MAARLVTLRAAARRAAAVHGYGSHYSYSYGRIAAAFAAQRRFYASALPEHIVVAFPSLSPTMTTGTLQQWNVKVGDEVAAGDSLGDVETDKATMSFDSTEDGVVAKLLVEDGTSDIEIGQPVMILVEDKADVEAFADYEPPAQETKSKTETSSEKPSTPPPETPVPQATSPPAEKTKDATQSASTPASSSDRIFASPLARRLAEKAGIALTDLSGTGPKGRITKADVNAYQAAPQPRAVTASPSAPPSAGAEGAAGDYQDLPLSTMRKTIAKRLQESKQTVPHYYLTSEIKMDSVLALRKRFNDSADGNFKLSVNDFIVKASARALLDVKECNSAWMDTFIRQNNVVDISIAVSTPSGLITPIVFDADVKGLKEISENVRDLAARARDGKLAPHEYQGGTFTISNLGMFGVKSFSAIINPPQACILAVGATQEQVVVDPSSESGFAAVNMMAVTLSCDHRVVDGAVGAQWLAAFKRYIEDPTSILL